MTKQFLIFVGYNPVFEMPKGQKIYLNLFFVCFSLMFAVLADAQERVNHHQTETLMENGDSLRSIYRFDESVSFYEKALAMAEETLNYAGDSLLRLELQDKILMSENGRNMAGFVDVPNVLAR